MPSNDAGETDAQSTGDGEAPDASGPQPPGADCPRVQVSVPGTVLNVRPSPDTSGAPVGVLSDGAIVDVIAIVQGETLDGVNTWYQIKTKALEGYIFSGLASCTTKEPPSFDGFYLPFACGKQVKVTQGNNTTFSHKGLSAYAFDFSLGIGTKMIAMAPGTVSYVYAKTQPGDPCYNGGNSSCIDKANQVWVKHPDGTQTIYAHLSQVSVKLNQAVSQGQLVGLSGSTGYSTGPHAHVARIKSCCQSIPLKFNDVPGGVPKTGDTVTSGNCL